MRLPHFSILALQMCSVIALAHPLNADEPFVIVPGPFPRERYKLRADSAETAVNSYHLENHYGCGAEWVVTELVQDGESVESFPTGPSKSPPIGFIAINTSTSSTWFVSLPREAVKDGWRFESSSSQSLGDGKMLLAVSRTNSTKDVAGRRLALEWELANGKVRPLGEWLPLGGLLASIDRVNVALEWPKVPANKWNGRVVLNDRRTNRTFELALDFSVVKCKDSKIAVPEAFVASAPGSVIQISQSCSGSTVRSLTLNGGRQVGWEIDASQMSREEFNGRLRCEAAKGLQPGCQVLPLIVSDNKRTVVIVLDCETGMIRTVSAPYFERVRLYATGNGELYGTVTYGSTMEVSVLKSDGTALWNYSVGWASGVPINLCPDGSIILKRTGAIKKQSGGRQDAKLIFTLLQSGE